MSRFRLHAKLQGKEYVRFLVIGLASAAAIGTIGYLAHSAGVARAKSRETVLIHTEEEFQQYLLDQESEEYNLSGRYRLEADLDLSWLENSVGTNLEPFTGKLDGNGHVISGLGRPLFGVMKKAEATNLFFSDAVIRSPFTYYDGERYVDGYGALVAYAVDSVIENCGMNGDIYTASPAEAEYLLEKASSPDADERMEPGAGGPGVEESQVESSPVMESGNEGEAAGPGVETGDVSGSTGTEGTAEAGPGVETTGGSAAGDSSASSESSLPVNDGTETVPTSEKEENGTEASTSKAVEETGAVSGEEQGSNAVRPSESGSTVEKTESSENKTPEGTTEPGAESATDETKEAVVEDHSEEVVENAGEVSSDRNNEGAAEPPSDGGNDGTATGSEDSSVDRYSTENAALTETIGFRINDRQHLMMKVPEMAGPAMEEILTASPSDATPSDAEMGPGVDSSDLETETEEGTAGLESDAADETKEREYIGNPDGDIYILVTAERITAGGLIAQTAGETLISGSFALTTISSAQSEIETYTGGLAGILGAGTRAENSYATGLADSTGVVGGFAAVNEGTIENSYAAVTIGSAGSRRHAFAAMGDGRLRGCVYDRQMACADGEDISYEVEEWDTPSNAEELSEENTPLEAQEFSLRGMRTDEITGMDSQVPGIWRKTENAYPQLEYFALHEHEAASASSKASAIALILPGELTLADVVKNGDIVLPSEIDGEAVIWEAEGDIRINEQNQVVSDEMAAILESGSEAETVTETEEEVPAEIHNIPSIESHDVPKVGSSLEAASVTATPSDAIQENTESSVTEITESETGETAGRSNAQLKASVGPVSRNFAISSLSAAAASTYANWGDVGAAVYNKTITGTDFVPKLNSEGYYEIKTPEAFAWFSYVVNSVSGKTGINGKLMSNIDLSGLTYGGSAETPLQWKAIGINASTLYTGTFDGGKYTIHNLYINDPGGRESYTGLFGYINNAIIKNIIVSQADVNGGSAGGIVGLAQGASYLITGCGLESGSVKGVGNCAGILCQGADNSTGIVSECYNKASISISVDAAGKVASGIVGRVDRGSISILRCYNLGDIWVPNKSDTHAAGIFPYAFWKSTIDSCYNAGNIANVNADKYQSGGIGATISITWPGTVPTHCYNLEGIGTLTAGNGTQISEKAMKSWGFVYELNGKSLTGVWKYNEGGYPELGTPVGAPNWGAVAQGIKDGFIVADSVPQDSTTGVYNISTPEHLAQFAYMVNEGGANLKASLAANIDLTGALYGGDDVNPILWTPIAQGTRTFTGTFQGNGKTISPVHINGTEKLGLFGTLGSGARVEGVTIIGSRFQKDTSLGPVQYAGGIAGYMGGDGAVISNCQFTTSLELPKAGTYFGGIVGGMGGSNNLITECVNPATISATGDYFGGIVGYIEGSGNTITKCQNQKKIMGNGKYQGGIAGGSGGSNAAIDGCSNEAGGMVAVSNASGSELAMGGILGVAETGTITVRNCYNQGQVTGNSSVGGIIGKATASAKVSGCYNAGAVSGSGFRSIAGTNSGNGNITHCYYLKTGPSDENARGITAEAMKTWAAAYALNGEKLSQPTGISWTYDTGNAYPTYGTLPAAESWETVGEGVANGFYSSIPTGEPLQIGSAEQLAWFAREINGGRLPAGTAADIYQNIDLAGSQCVTSGKLNWIPIGKDSAHAYTGQFRSVSSNGAIYRIRNMYVNTTGEAGLFGVVDSGGTISAVGIEDANITGQIAAGITGVLKGSGKISRCYHRRSSATSSVTGVTHAGGIVGQMVGNAGVKDCYNMETLIRSSGAGSGAGGIAGDGSVGSITNCYHTNRAPGSDTTGSVIAAGTDGGSITGKPASSMTVKSCYSDISLPLDQAYVGKLDYSTDEKTQTQVDLLNTLDGVENKGAARSWFTSLTEEGTKGLPTLEPPVMVTVTVDPANVSETGGNLTGDSGTWGPGSLPGNLLYRGIHQENGGASQPGFILTDKGTVTSNFHIYGTDNAHQNLTLEMGGRDLYGLNTSASLKNPTTEISGTGNLSFYAGASYIFPEKRTLVVDMAEKTTGAGGEKVITRYEIRMEVKGVVRKTLSVSLPVKTYMELKPGVDTKAYTTNLSIINREASPVKFGITSVAAKETTEAGIDRKLEPIASSVTIDQTKTLAQVKLGIEGNFSSGGTGALEKSVYYYTPAQGGNAASWLNCDIGYGQKLDYRYFIEHGILHIGPKQHFGFNIVYQFGIPADNVGSVVRGSAS